MSDVEDAEAVALQRKTAAELGRRAVPDNGGDDAQQIEFEDIRRLAEQAKELGKDITEPKSDQTTEDSPNYEQDNSTLDLRPVKAAAAIKVPESSEDSRHSERGIHSLTQSVTDEVSGLISEVDYDDGHFDQTEVSKTPVQELQRLPLIQKSRDYMQVAGHRSELDDDFEGGDGESESESTGQSHELHSEDLRNRRSSSLNEGRRAGHEEGGEGLPRASEDLQQQSTEAQIDSGAGHRCYPQRSDSEEVSSRQKDLEVARTVSHHTESDAVSNLGTLATEPKEDDEESAQQARLDSEISVYYSQQLDPDVINPFSLEDRIRQAREQQNLSLNWDVDNATAVGLLLNESVGSDSQPQSSLDEISRSIIPELEEISSDQQTGSLEKGFESPLVSEIKVRRSTASGPDELPEEGQEVAKTKTGTGEAVLLGALASGVNVRSHLHPRTD